MPTSREQILATYVPRLGFLGSQDGGPPPQTPHVEAAFCVVLFADLSGFTTRTEQLSARTNASDEIAHLLNSYLGPLVEVVHQHGGDVLKFAGDALLVSWDVGNDTDAIRNAVLAAATCAMEMMVAVQRTQDGDPTRAMNLKVGIAAGPVRILHLGIPDGRRVLLVMGDGVDRATRVGAEALPGEVRLGRLAHLLVAEELSVQSMGDTQRLLDVAPLDTFALPVRPRPAWDERFSGYLPRTVLHQLRGRQGHWLTENRVISAVFIHLGKLSLGTDARRLNQLFITTHRLVHDHGGVTNKLSIDEKGATLLAVFGLPPEVHEDNAARACRAAMAILRTLKREGEEPSIGIATGRAFCGEVGGRERREYTVIGDTVNVAARLMQHARGEVVVDAPTARRAGRLVRFETLQPVGLKGKTGAISVFRPRSTVSAAQATQQRTEVVGRQQVIDSLFASAQTALQQQVPVASVLAASAGVGKTALANVVSEALADRDFLCLRTSGEILQKDRVGYPWQRILARLYGVGQAARETSAIRDALQQAAGDQAHLLTLLDDLLPVPMPGAARRAPQSHPHIKASVLSRLLLARITDQPVLLIVEDAHWFDPLSLQVLTRLCAAPGPRFVLVTTRLPPEAPGDVWTALHNIGAVQTIENLDREAIHALVARRLRVPTLPRELLDVIMARSGGNPLFVLHLTDHLRTMGAVRVEKQVCQIDTNRLHLWQTELPSTLEALLLARVDQLSPEAQFSLKVASVYGDEFRAAALSAAHPYQTSEHDLASDLAEMTQQELVFRADGTAPGTYRFRHTLIRDAVYEIIPFHQKQQLHGAAARYLAGLTPTPWFDVAEHANAAQDEDAAFDAYTRAAAMAAQAGLPEDCGKVLEAIELLVPLFPPTELQAARVAIAAAITEQARGDMVLARAHMAAALQHIEAAEQEGAVSEDDLNLAAARLLAARVNLRAGAVLEAIRDAQECRRTPNVTSSIIADSYALEAHSAWLLGGLVRARAVLAQVGPHTSWEVRAERVLCTLAEWTSISEMETALVTVEELLLATDAHHADLVTLSRVTSALVGLHLVMGLAEAALEHLQNESPEATTPWSGALQVLAALNAGIRPPMHAVLQLIHHPVVRGPAHGFTSDVASAAIYWAAGDEAQARSFLDTGLKRWSPNIFPTPDLWPALITASKLLLAMANSGRTHPDAFLRIDAILIAAERSAPTVELPFGFLRGQLALSRGQWFRGWWNTRRRRPKIQALQLDGLLTAFLDFGSLTIPELYTSDRGARRLPSHATATAIDELVRRAI